MKSNHVELRQPGDIEIIQAFFSFFSFLIKQKYPHVGKLKRLKLK